MSIEVERESTAINDNTSLHILLQLYIAYGATLCGGSIDGIIERAS